ncbi:MAG: hypothetical protein VCD00_18160 [Candidatus Hydrogenedentota bacterium]
MSDDIRRAIKSLGDPDTGWVHRRDAVELLAKAVHDSLGALHAHKNDSDRDVQTSVAKALNAIGIDAPVPVDDAASLEKLVMALESKGNREVSKTDSGFEVVVNTKNGRSQTVSIEATISNTKQDVIRVTTICGPASESSYEWALTNNNKMSHCSLALDKRDGETWLVLVNNHLAEAITFEELKLTVKEVAFYGDWVEDKLTGEDNH